MIINKKIKRTILEGKSQYFGSVVLIMISCLLFTMLSLLSNNMNSLTSLFEKKNVLEDASFVTGDKLPNIPDLESKFNALIEEGGTFDYAVSSDKTLRVFSENTKVDIPAVIEGKKLDGNDILIDPAYAAANKLKVGDTIKIFDKSFVISGFMSLPNYIYPLKSENDLMSDPKSFGVAVIDKSDFDSFNLGSTFYSIKFSSNRSNVEDQAAKFRDYLKSINIIVSKWADIGDNKRVSFVNTKIEGIDKISSSMPVAILLLTCILTGIVIWRLLNREAPIIGTLYAEGYRRKEIRKHYMMYPLLIALTGGIPGTILGVLLLQPMLKYMVSFFNIPLSSMSFNPVIIVVSLLLPVILLGLSGSLVLNKALKFSPVELMRGIREKSRVNFIERVLKLDNVKFKTKFKIREQLRSLSRLSFLLAGVVLATMLLLLGFTAKSSIDYIMKDNIRNTYKFQYEYVYNSLHSEKPPAGAEEFSAATFTSKSKSKVVFEICGIDPAESYISLKGKNGAELSKDSVIITKSLAENLNVAPGDTIQVVNKLDSREYTVTVQSIAETYVGQYIFMPISQFNNMLGFPTGSYIGLWSKDKLDIPEKQLYSFQTVDDSIKAFNASTQPLQATVGVISLMSFIIGLIVIYVVTSLIIEENKGNISLMKIFGYRKREVNSLILNSSTIVVVAGYIIGIPLIISSMSALFKSLTESLNLTLPVTISFPYILIGFVVVYLTYELSKALSRRKVNNISMSEALKYGME